jgi:nitroreductase|tara:strand:+ start:101 stop:778 length:678 start_codon:yes stop_codon:yes gene_type:complete
MNKKLEFQKLTDAEMRTAAKNFYTKMKTRRTVRDFSDRPVPPEVIRNALLCAGTAPSGANMQPWHFAVTTDSKIKTKIKAAAEEEEKIFYEKRASDEWLAALNPLGTNQHKPFLETAPVLIGVFLKKFTFTQNGERLKNYYPYESVGIACGLLISALHLSGLATLTHTPSPMAFLNKAFARPKTERPYLLLVVGYPKNNCEVPTIDKRSFNEIVSVVGEQTENFF